MKTITREECERDPNAALDSAVSGPVAIVDERGAMRGVLSIPGDPPKRTLEEILAYSRETGTDWALTADEAGLLRREVERLRERRHEASANPSEDPAEANHIEEIRLWLEREPGPYRHEVDDARDAAAWLLAVLDGRAVTLTSERERAAKADALMLEKMHGLERVQFDQRTLLTQKADLETQLAEERAKREAAEEKHALYKEENDDAIAGQLVSEREIERERADNAGRELANAENDRDSWRDKANKLEATLQAAIDVGASSIEEAEAFAKRCKGES